MPEPRRTTPREVSIEDSDAIALAYEHYVGEDDARCLDPFDIVAALEEELGHPLALS